MEQKKAVAKKREESERKAQHELLQAQMSQLEGDEQIRAGIDGDYVRVSKRGIKDGSTARHGRAAAPAGGTSRVRSRSPNPTPRGFGSSSPSRVADAGRNAGRSPARGGSPAQMHARGGNQAQMRAPPRVASLSNRQPSPHRRNASPGPVGFGSSSRRPVTTQSPARRASPAPKRPSSPGLAGSARRGQRSGSPAPERPSSAGPLPRVATLGAAHSHRASSSQRRCLEGTVLTLPHPALRSVGNRYGWPQKYRRIDRTAPL